MILLAAPAVAQAVDVNAAERAEVNHINSYRKTHGLSNLLIDAKLTAAAEWMSTDMAANNYFSHTDRLGRDPFDRIAHYGYPSDTWRGENLAAGNEDPDATFEQWRNSPAHNENMLDAHYRAIGIARVYDPGSTYGYFWTTSFGSRVVDKWQTPEEVARFDSYQRRVRSTYNTRAKRAFLKRRVQRCKTLRAGSASHRRLRCQAYLRAGRVLGYR